MSKYQGFLSHYLNSDDFSSQAKEKIENCNNKEDKKLALISLDFDNFNFINDLFSYDIGNEVLQRITLHFSKYLEKDELFSRFHADHFTFLLWDNKEETLINRLREMCNVKELLLDILPTHYNLVSSGGIVYANEYVESIASLLDKANFARKQAKGNHIATFLIYDEKLSAKLKWQKAITLNMESALKNHDFEMYLQPKILIKTNEIVGAEALVRWNSKTYGMIYPDQFIPILEQNGFITEVDFFMLEEACLFLKNAPNNNISPLPISVNFSKVHIRNPHFAEDVFNIVKKHKVSTKLIEIEFTENIFLSDFEALVEIAGALKYLGFKVTLDDFGSAYSSLNYLKNVPLDIIKIDKNFLDSSTNSEKGRIIIAKVVELIKSLQLASVMEGVETQEQVEFLKKLSCDLGQGYFYAKPMPIQNYLKFVKENPRVANFETAMKKTLSLNNQSSWEAIPQEFQMDNWELYTLGKNIDMALMKGYLDGDGTVQYVNDKALEYIGYSRQEFREKFNNKITAFTHPDDVDKVNTNIKKLIETGKPLEFQTRALRKDGKTITIKGRASCVIDNGGRPVGIYAYQDVTQELERTQALQHAVEEKIAELEKVIESERKSREELRLSEERYRLIVEQSNDIMFEWDFITDSISFSHKFITLLKNHAVQNHISTNAELRKQVHPDDLPSFEKWVKNTYKSPTFSEAEYRLLYAEQQYIWMRVRSTPICNEAGEPLKAVGVFTNIDKEKNDFDTLIKQAQHDSLTTLYNKEETRKRIEESILTCPNQQATFFIIDVDNFKGINDKGGHPLGDAILTEIAQNIKNLFRKDDIVGRIGGDEIAVFTGNIPREKDIHFIATRLLNAIPNISTQKIAPCTISGSIGIACYPQHGKTFDELYNLSDIALYQSKNSGKNRYTIYNEKMKNSLQQNNTLK
ncbi:MAG: EAL domain-containing protein [Clostridiales bacterium]